MREFLRQLMQDNRTARSVLAGGLTGGIDGLAKQLGSRADRIVEALRRNSRGQQEGGQDWTSGTTDQPAGTSEESGSGIQGSP